MSRPPKVGGRKTIDIPGKAHSASAAVALSLATARRLTTMLLSFANFILPFFNILFPPNVPQRSTLTFRLRHFHAVTPSAHVYFADVPPLSTLNADTHPLSISTAPVRTSRPISASAFSEARALSMRAQSAALDWEDHEIPGPDISKRETLLLLAKMTSNAYVEPDTDAWYNLTDEWGIVRSLNSSVSHLQLILWFSTRRSGGSLMTTASEDTSSLQTTTVPSCSPSKARPRCWLAAGQPRRKIS